MHNLARYGIRANCVSPGFHNTEMTRRARQTSAESADEFIKAVPLGYLAEADLDGSPYLHLCENRPYDYLDERELARLIEELGATGDQLEQLVNGEADAL